MLAMLVPRLGLRVMSKLPAHVPGNKLEVLAGQASHLALYGFMIFMPVSGMVMGYFGGKGVPFFGLATIPGAQGDDKRPAIAKQAYKNHKLAGEALT